MVIEGKRKRAREVDGWSEEEGRGKERDRGREGETERMG